MTELWYSTDEEIFNYNNIEDIAGDILYGTEVGDTATIYVGEKRDNKASNYVRNITDGMADAAADEHWELSDSWPHSTAEQDKELSEAIEKLVDEWADKYKLHPTFFKISNVKEIVVEKTVEGFKVDG